MTQVEAKKYYSFDEIKKVVLKPQERDLVAIIRRLEEEMPELVSSDDVIDISKAVIGSVRNPLFYITSSGIGFPTKTSEACFHFKKPDNFSWDNASSMFDALFSLDPAIIREFDFVIRTHSGFNIQFTYRLDKRGKKELWIDFGYGNCVYGDSFVDGDYNIKNIVRDTNKLRKTNWTIETLMQEIASELRLRQVPFNFDGEILNLPTQKGLHIIPIDYDKQTLIDELKRTPVSARFSNYGNQRSLIWSLDFSREEIIVGLNISNLRRFEKTDKTSVYGSVQRILGINIPEGIASNRVTLYYKIGVDPGPY